MAKLYVNTLKKLYRGEFEEFDPTRKRNYIKYFISRIKQLLWFAEIKVTKDNAGNYYITIPLHLSVVQLRKLIGLDCLPRNFRKNTDKLEIPRWIREFREKAKKIRYENPHEITSIINKFSGIP